MDIRVRREAAVDAVRAAAWAADGYGVGIAAVLQATFAATMDHAAAHETALAAEVDAAPSARLYGKIGSVPWGLLQEAAGSAAWRAAGDEAGRVDMEAVRIAREVHRPTRADACPPRGPRSRRYPAVTQPSV